MGKYLGYLFILAVMAGLFALAFLHPNKPTPSPIALETDVLDLLAEEILPREALGVARESEPRASLQQVVRIIDGDTFVARLNGKDESVRLIGIDTPELNERQPYAEEAKEKSAELLMGGWVRLELDVRERDKYGRILAYVYVPMDSTLRLHSGQAGSPQGGDGELFVNLELVRQGYAQVLTIPPDVAHADDFREAQKLAQEENLGLWSLD